MPSINELIQKIALSAVEDSKPMAFTYGEVVSSSPLKIAIAPKLTLKEEQLILTNNVRDYDVEMTVDHKTEWTGGGSGETAFESHCHTYVGRKKYTVHNALVEGDKVCMTRLQGGQKYMVIEKVVSL